MRGLINGVFVLVIWSSIVVLYNSGHLQKNNGFVDSTLGKFIAKENIALQRLFRPLIQPLYVTASIKSGSYDDTQIINLKTSLPVSTIYYSLDGTEPTVNDKYQNSVKVYGTETLTFVAVNLLTGAKSTVVSETYLLPSINERMIIDCKNYDPILIKDIKNEINKLDSIVLRRLFTQDIRIKLINNFADEPELRGYSIPKHALALYYDKTIYALIDQHQFDGQVSTYIHELGHAYDFNTKIRGKMLSEQADFQAFWQDESLALLPNVDYYNSSSIETFAQCFALFYYSEVSKQYLKLKAPQIYAYLEKVTK